MLKRFTPARFSCHAVGKTMPWAERERVVQEELIQSNKEHHFLRIHRSYLINPDYVIRYTKGKGGSVTMKNNKELEMSIEKRHQFLGMFEK